ncbi:thioesterase family protein [Desulfobacterales bacterium]|nr:thioesterase family protein [Desulfobacterales bacterium]
MPTQPDKLDELLQILGDIYENRLPFNKVLGLHIVSLKPDLVKVAFDMTDSLIGNYVQGSLHGGVISSVLDTVGGLTATAGMIQKKVSRPKEEIAQNIAKVGTIDLRVDYLRPGKGSAFTSSASIMRIGKKVAVTRMELHNNHGRLIAVGTGTYLIA